MSAKWVEKEENKRWESKNGNLTVKLDAAASGSSNPKYYVALVGYGQQLFVKSFMAKGNLKAAQETAIKIVDGFLENLKEELHQDNKKYFENLQAAN